MNEVAPTIHGETPEYGLVPYDLYRDVHKAIRVNIFDVVSAAGRVDPHDRAGRIALAARVADLVDFLVFHAEHEDRELDGPIAEVLPQLAAEIGREHVALEAQMEHLKALAYLAFDDARTDARAAVHELYLCLAAFAAQYLAHQDVEERIVMPALCAHYGVEPLLEIHGRILAAIAPDRMAWSLTKMLPSMNADDRFDMFFGMRLDAPPEAFDATLGLAADVLATDDHAQLVARLEATAVPA